MKNFSLALLIFCSCASAAQVTDNNCKSPVSGTATIMMDKMHEKMHIDTRKINVKETTTKLLFNEPVNDILSDYYTETSHENEGLIEPAEYKEIYSEHNPRNLIIKFIFKNNEGKEDIFLVSTIANDYECNVKFNGYIIIKREF